MKEYRIVTNDRGWYLAERRKRFFGLEWWGRATCEIYPSYRQAAEAPGIRDPLPWSMARSD